MVARRLRPLVAAVAVAGWGLVIGGTLHEARAGGSTAVQIADFAFSPSTITITAGDTVTWTNADPVVHTATSTSGAFDSGDLEQGESYSLTFTTPGTYDYLCTPHPTMTGRIVVQAANPSSPAPTAVPPSNGGSIPNVAMPEPTETVVPLAGLGFLIAGLLATAVRRRSRSARR